MPGRLIGSSTLVNQSCAFHTLPTQSHLIRTGDGIKVNDAKSVKMDPGSARPLPADPLTARTTIPMTRNGLIGLQRLSPRQNILRLCRRSCELYKVFVRSPRQLLPNHYASTSASMAASACVPMSGRKFLSAGVLKCRPEYEKSCMKSQQLHFARSCSSTGWASLSFANPGWNPWTAV